MRGKRYFVLISPSTYFGIKPLKTGMAEPRVQQVQFDPLPFVFENAWV
jgi:hypothetical protein